MSLSAAVEGLRAEARATNQRRLLVVHGDRDACIDAAYTALEAADVAPSDATLLTTREGYRYERVRPKHAYRLLGSTRDAVVLDAYEEFSANALGQTVGAVDGGGIYVLLAPPLDDWPDRRDDFDRSLAVPPSTVDDVTGRFRGRLVETLRSHPGVAIYDADAEALERNGLTGDEAPLGSPAPRTPTDHAFPETAYESCLTRDQSRAVAALERLRDSGAAVVVEADRGRGKSSAAGLAAGSLAVEGRDVLVTAPRFRGAEALFERARELLESEGQLVEPAATERGDTADERGRRSDDDGRRLEAAGGGTVRFRLPAEAAEVAPDTDVVLVDEAAALPVRLLERFLAAPSAAFVTTVHGYEGAGRGFSVRFRDRLRRASHDVTELRLEDPIRYARGDPVESWAFRALLLDASPAVDEVVEGAVPGSTRYRAVPPEDLIADEHLLGEAFGLLVLAHYRTEPDDLARLLDAPNLSLRVLTYDGHVVSVALLAREGGLDADTREAMYDGARVRGNMLPDVLTSQLRDPDAGVPEGIRVMRIATHHAVRSSGLGSRLLTEVRDELADDVDYLGTGFGATPELVRFWRRNNYRTVHLATTRNEASGEHSAVMLDPVSDEGEALHDRNAARFRDRVGAALQDALRDVDADVVRGVLRACDAAAAALLDLTEYEWRVVVGASYGPGLYDAAPRPFRRLALAHLLDGRAPLDARAERLLVRKVLQAHPWPEVAEELAFVSTGECMRALGAAYRELVDEYGDDVAREERARYE